MSGSQARESGRCSRDAAAEGTSSLNESASKCLRHTEIPSSTPLFLDLLYHYDRVSGFYPHPPSVSAMQEAAREIKFDAGHRETLVAALRRQNEGAATEAHLDLLAQPDTVVVATGQQVGLYGGPVFTLYKALTALKLAATLREKGTPAVAVFWLATEDHDLDEVSHTWIYNPSHQPIKLDAVTEPAPGRPVGGVAATDPRPALLRDALSPFRAGEQAHQLARSAYRQGGTFQAGFYGLYRQLLESYGLIFLDPMDRDLRRLAAPIFQKAIAEAPSLSEELLRRNAELEQAGYHAQVYLSDETSLVFLLEDDRRTVLRRQGDVYSNENGRHTTRELLDRMAQAPHDFSPNALLRPVTQDWLLPTAVYVGGPAELAYLAQAQVLYKRLLGRMPVVVPRASFTVVDARSRKLLRRYQLAVTDGFEGAEALRNKIAQRLIPPALETGLLDAETQIDTALGKAESDLEKFDPTLQAALRKSTAKIRYQFHKIRGKVAQESLRRDQRGAEEAAYLSHSIFPENSPQERLYSVLPFLAEHGFEFVDRIYGAIQPECHDHQILTI